MFGVDANFGQRPKGSTVPQCKGVPIGHFASAGGGDLHTDLWTDLIYHQEHNSTFHRKENQRYPILFNILRDGNVIVKTTIRFRPDEVDRTSNTVPLSTISLRVNSLAALSAQDAPRGTRFLSPAPI
jgi:hypothetical protein